MIAFKIEDRLKISLYQVYHSSEDKSTACDILNQSLHDKAPGMLRGLMLYSVPKEYAVIVARAIIPIWTCAERIIGAPLDYGQNEHSVISFALHRPHKLYKPFLWRTELLVILIEERYAESHILVLDWNKA